MVKKQKEEAEAPTLADTVDEKEWQELRQRGTL